MKPSSSELGCASLSFALQVKADSFRRIVYSWVSVGLWGLAVSPMAEEYVCCGLIETDTSKRVIRSAQEVSNDGFAVGRYKARRLMRQAKLTVQRRKQRHPVTTDSRHGYTVAPNLLARQFAVAKPNQVWVGDITYVWTAEGWLDLGVLLDLYSRKVVGWAMSQRVDAALVQEALQMA